MRQQTARAGEGVEKGEPRALLAGRQAGAAPVESGVEVPRKLTMALPYDPAIPLSGIYLEKPQTLI